MQSEPPPTLLRLGDAYAFIDDDVVMLKSIDSYGDPVELTCDEARLLASWLRTWAARIDGGDA